MSNGISKTMTLTNIKGDSQLKTEDNTSGAVDVVQFHYAAQRPTERFGPNITAAGRPEVSTVSVDFKVCSAIGALAFDFGKGTNFNDVVLRDYKTDGTGKLKLFRMITLKDAQIKFFSVENSESARLTLDYVTLKDQFFKQDRTGAITAAGGLEYNAQESTFVSAS